MSTGMNRAITVAAAKQINSMLKGQPTENRVVIAISREDVMRASGIIVPTTADEALGKKGTIVQIGAITSEYDTYKPLLQVGAIISHGIYAGKKLDIEIGLDNIELMVLSINEIIYVEPNN